MEEAIKPNQAREIRIDDGSWPPEMIPEKIQDVFGDFSRIAENLDQSYLSLEKRMDILRQDLTKEHIARLQEREEKEKISTRLAAMVSAIPSAVLVVNRLGLVIDCNQQATDYFGDSLIGWGWEQLKERESIAPHHDSDKTVFMDYQSYQEIRLRDGRILSQTISSLAGSADATYFFNDVTEIHQHKDEIARRQRLAAMGELTAGMAHQIRTPLSSAYLYLDQLKNSARHTKNPEEVISKLHERLDHVGSLVNSMLDFVRCRKTDMHVFSTNELVDLVTALVNPDLQRTTSFLETHLPKQELHLEAEPRALAGAIANLIINAIDIIGSDARIKMEISEQSNNLIEIAIQDNGPGIDEGNLTRIFDPFFTTRTHGTGLGLAVVAATVKDFAGDIAVRNIAQGGARFSIKLPIDKTKDFKAQKKMVKEI